MSQSTLVRPVILIGGKGTRLWPLSREQSPKQFMALASERSMLEETAARFVSGGFLAPVVVCAAGAKHIVADRLQRAGISPAAMILEPEGRNTAPAAIAAALWAERNGEQALQLVVPADHVIADLPAFHDAIARAAALARDGRIATFGITPTEPSTAYGYIRRGAPIGDAAYGVAAFVEKPDGPTAAAYLAARTYTWNSGIFLFRPDVLLAEARRIAPELAAACDAALPAATPNAPEIAFDPERFARVRAVSIDYAIMEHTDKAGVVPVDMGWSDVGSWTELARLTPKDADDNALRGRVVALGCSGTYVHAGDRLVAALGVQDLVIVDTKDAVLVAHRDETQAVKAIVDRLVTDRCVEAREHPTVERPWGSYTRMGEGTGFQIKRIDVKPGGRLSLQKHRHRAEHWVVAAGEALVTCGERVTTLGPNDSVFIPQGAVHPLENPGTRPVVLIEVQIGDYLGEDDIVRLQDDYGRIPEGIAASA